jgi:hypothetical protein
MVAGGVRIQVLPQALDAVVLRTVRRQEVRPELRTHLSQQLLDPFGLVVQVVDEDWSWPGCLK